MPNFDLRGLVREATEAAEWRGHSLVWSKPFRVWKGEGRRGQCLTCGMEVQVEDDPAPNSIDIGGEAVALNCRPRSVGIIGDTWDTSGPLLRHDKDGWTVE